MKVMILNLLIVLWSLFDATREVIDLYYKTGSPCWSEKFGKWFRWETRYKTVDAWHAYPFLAYMCLVTGLLMNPSLLYITYFLFVGYQFRNLFIHRILSNCGCGAGKTAMAFMFAFAVVLVVLSFLYPSFLF